MSSLWEVIVKVQGADLVPAQNLINFLPIALNAIWFHFQHARVHRWRSSGSLFPPLSWSSRVTKPLSILVVTSGLTEIYLFFWLCPFHECWTGYAHLYREQVLGTWRALAHSPTFRPSGLCWEQISQTRQTSMFIWFQNVLLAFRDVSSAYF